MDAGRNAGGGLRWVLLASWVGSLLGCTEPADPGLERPEADGSESGAPTPDAAETGEVEGSTTTDDAGPDQPDADLCADPATLVVGDSVLRRITRFEYNNIVRDLLGDETLPANALPSEESGNGFGNYAETQAVSRFLAEQYLTVAEDVASRATADLAELAEFAPCLAAVTAETEATCTATFIETFVARAFRRPATTDEQGELLALQASIRASSTYAESLASTIEAVLLSPDFLYRPEFGQRDQAGRLRPTGHEMASRLAFLLWGSLPDDELLVAAEQGQLDSAEGVRRQAERMLSDPRTRRMVEFFFDNLLPIRELAALERSKERYPAFHAQIGAAMRLETQRLLEELVFTENGSWRDALQADYTYLNGPLAAYYGVPGVEGETFQRVPLDTSQRRGILTHAGVVSGPIHSNETNPVTRGAFLMKKIMCREIPLPTDAGILDEIKPPDPEGGPTARIRYAQHSEDPRCAGCHTLMDPVGLTFENYDAVGQWRTTENDVLIDASGGLPGVGTAASAVELVQLLADAPDTHVCFAEHWFNFAMGGRLDGANEEHACIRERLGARFLADDTNIQSLLLGLTQTDAFLYLPEESRDE